MRISDWSSDVCSSDLDAGREAAHGRLGRSPFDAVPRGAHEALPRDAGGRRRALEVALRAAGLLGRPALRPVRARCRLGPREGLDAGGAPAPARSGAEAGIAYAVDRKSVVKGKRVSVRVDYGGGRTVKKKTKRKIDK